MNKAQMGWGLFILCSIFYLISGIKSGDVYAITGAVLFFFACFFFIGDSGGKRK